LKKSITTAVLCALCATVVADVGTPREARATTSQQRLLRPDDVLRAANTYRRQTWRWQFVMGVRRTPTRHTAARATNISYRIWVRNLWRRRATLARRRAFNPPHEQQWRCIHSFEGAWQSNTGNGYYGGLQMDITFQRQYGSWLLRRKGTADRWTPIEQMWVAERAHRSGQGLTPWPNTARACGLI
jgi:hypothetical protein